MGDQRDPKKVIDELRHATGELNRLIAEAEGQGIRIEITVHERETIQMATNGPQGLVYKDLATSSTRIDWEASEIIPLGGLHERS